MKQSYVFNSKLRLFPLANGNGLTNGIWVYAAKPNFRRAPIKVFRDALKYNYFLFNLSSTISFIVSISSFGIVRDRLYCFNFQPSFVLTNTPEPRAGPISVTNSSSNHENFSSGDK